MGMGVIKVPDGMGPDVSGVKPIPGPKGNE